ncbi:ATP-dependent Clp protease adaptor protein ClpS (plasmid) [Nostoc linckia NIES-25]|nr:ATP-dependent Clp protease adaptor protein ClpS [Nostoc linckia NIES-25]
MVTTLSANRPLAKVLFARGGKREKVKGERQNTKPFPLSPSPFPDFCKKSNVYGMATAPTVAPERSNQVVPKTYPNYKVIVLNDDFNTFQHVAECLMKYIPGMSGDRAWDLTNQVHYEGQAIVWVGPQEPAELYHQQLRRAGLTMAPLEAA